MLTAEIDEHHRHMIASAPRVGTLAQFDDQVAEAARRWKKSGRPAPRVWFRGQRDAALPLIPSALRKPFGSLDFRIQHGMFVEFRRRALGLTEHVPETVWGWLYLAQHHGFPTPLLDWSESSHVALFFALQRKPGATWKRDRDACVWVLNAGRLNEIGWGFSDVVTVRDDGPTDALTQMERLLVLLAERAPFYGAVSAIDSTAAMAVRAYLPRMPKGDVFNSVLSTVGTEGYITHVGGLPKLTHKGWTAAQSARKTMRSGNQAFVAMWFHGDMDALFDQAFDPALRACG